MSATLLRVNQKMHVMEAIQTHHSYQAYKILESIASQITQVPCAKHVSLKLNITVRVMGNVLIVLR